MDLFGFNLDFNKKTNRSVAGACLTFIKARLIFYKENKKDKYYEQRIL
jgi:hypothetical protein